MANSLRQSLVWRDSKGQTVSNRFYLSSGGTAITQAAAGQAVLNAELAITNAAFQSSSGPLTSVARQVVYGTTAQFPAITDKAIYVFSATDGTLHRFQVPAPKIAIFEVDQVTIDAAQADSAAFITAVLGNVFTADGEALVTFVGGTRAARKLHRRINIFIKVPELDEIAE